jgi:protein-disulfide isomerase
MRLFLALAALLALLGPASAQYYGSTVDVPQLMMPGPLGDKGMGDPKAPVTVIEYASMTCPHCQRFHTDTYPALKAKYIDTGKVYFILREFPLDALAYAAFMVARCSGDKYFPVIDTLFDHQEEWAFVRNPVEKMISFVEPYGMGGSEFEKCIDDPDIFDHVEFVATRGGDVFGVEGTPTFFFNGRRAVGELSADAIDQIVAPMLAAPR